MKRQTWMLLLVGALSAGLAGCGAGNGSSGSNSSNSGSGATGSNSGNASAPTVATVSPNWITAGVSGTLTVTGSNFNSGTELALSCPNQQSATFTGTYVSATELQINLTLQSAGLCQLSAVNTGGAASGALNLTVVGFTKGASMATPRSSPAVTPLASGDLLITGGYVCAPPSPSQPTGGCSTTASNAAELYALSSNSFTLIHAMNSVRALHTATLLANGKVLIAGGSNFGATGSALASAELYDPSTQTFTLTGSLATARLEATATLLPDGKVLIAGGSASGGSSIGSAELYDPSTGTFSPTGSLNTSRYRHTATLLPNGKVLIVGGLNYINAGQTGASSQILASAEIYDPSTGLFVPAPQGLITARYWHRATLMPGGKVLIAGGQSGGSSMPQNTAELYDPGNGTFSSTGNLVSYRESQTAILLATGQVLQASGQLSGSSAELYDAAAGTFSATGGLNVARSEQNGVLLPNLQALIVGGFTGSGLSSGMVAQSELYLAPPVQTPLVPAATALWPSSASVGTAVIVQGSGFLPGFTVKLDGAAQQSSYFDETLLGFTIPAGTTSGTHQVVIANPAGGTSATLSLTVQ